MIRNSGNGRENMAPFSLPSPSLVLRSILSNMPAVIKWEFALIFFEGGG